MSAPAQRLPSPIPNEESILRSKKHFCYACHFPIAQDEVSQHEANQVSGSSMRLLASVE